VVSIASHVVGNEIKEMLNSFAAGDVKRAQELHSHLFPMFKGLFITTNPVPVKEALNILGMNVGGLRLPLCQANEAEIIQLQKLLASYNLA